MNIVSDSLSPKVSLLCQLDSLRDCRLYERLGQAQERRRDAEF